MSNPPAVLITGGSSAIGLASAAALARDGFRVYAGLRDLNKRNRVLQQRIELHPIYVDVTDQPSIDAAVEQIARESDGIYGLVNNAAVGLRGCLEDLSEAEIRRVFEVNVFGTMAMTRAVLPHLRRARRGRVLTVTSVGGRIASFGLSAYCASKFALEGFAEALSLEIAPFGLFSCLIEPGMIPTEYWGEKRGTASAALNPKSAYSTMFQRHEEMADRIVARSRNRPEHVAAAVHRAMTARRPRLRYLVGQPAGMLLTLRRYLPGELFERVYFGAIVRRLRAAGV